MDTKDTPKKIPTSVALFSSSVSGALHIMIGYPFDTIKTLYQQNIYTKTYRIYTETSMKRLFQGMTYPLVQNTAINSICFGLNNFFINHSENKHVGNVLTAAVSTVIITPFDKFKIMKQCNIPYELSVSNVMRSFRNFHVVCLSEIPSTYLYFSVYQYLKQEKYSAFVSGGFAGMSSWILTYPMDTVKTRMQNESCKTIVDAYKGGGLYKGLGICLLRSYIVNGVNFYSYEKIVDLFRK